MPRTIIDIPQSLLRGLDDVCSALHISRAEGVRRAVDHFVKQQSQNTTEAFGMWREHITPKQKAKIAELR